MADYSMSPLDLLLANRSKGYVGIHIEQGVPVLDRDLNLLHDLVAAGVREVVTRYIGNGSPAGEDGFAVQAQPAPNAAQNVAVGPGASGLGRFLVGGIEVTIGQLVQYTDQVAAVPLTTPTPAQPDPRIDQVYLDVFLIEVDGVTDTDLTNAQDVGVQTSVRLKPAWVVRVAEGVPVPPPPPGHGFTLLAEIARPRGNPVITAAMITDRRQRNMTVSDVERRLRRVENALLPAFSAPVFTPKSGGAGLTVTVVGTNFNIGTVVVRFGDTVASVTQVTPTQLSAIVPQGIATEGALVQSFISVENAAGRAFVNAPFGVEPAPAFAAPGQQFSPPNGLPGVPVTIEGDNLNVPGLTVMFGDKVAAPIGAPTAHQVKVQVPPGLVTGGGTSATVQISITTDAGGVTSTDSFKAEQSAPAPTLTGTAFTPKHGSPGAVVTVQGTNFDVPNLTVLFGATNGTITGVTTPIQVQALVPTGIAAGQLVKITVTTDGGSATSTGNFLFDA